MNEEQEELLNIRREYLDFISERRCLNLSTVDGEGNPGISTSPFIMDGEKRFYIYISQLARHAQNLKQDRRAAVMIVENEEENSPVFARKRVSFDCEVALVERGVEEWIERMEEFRQEFGPVIDTLRELPDFLLFQLTPTGGLYVKGFGQAFKIGGMKMEEISRIGPPKSN